MRRSMAVLVVAILGSTFGATAPAQARDRALPKSLQGGPETSGPKPQPVSGMAGQVERWKIASDRSASRGRCGDYAFPVTAMPNSKQVYRVWGRMCTDGSFDKPNAQVLLHGGSYNHFYWDWPYKPKRYSYVRAAIRSDFVTLDVDRLGYGYSDHPLSLNTTFDSNAWVAHQLVQYLRKGALGASFKKVALVGNSMGGFTTFVEAGRYRDVDAAVVTGAVHLMNLPRIALETPGRFFWPAELDPKFKDKGYPLGYTTTWPGTRCELFYKVDATEPEVCSLDEELKDTINLGEWLTVFTTTPSPIPSVNITAPVMLVLGDHDFAMCDDVCQPGDLELRLEEELYYRNASSFRLYIQPNAGHVNNLHRTAPQEFDAINEWVHSQLD